MVFVPKTLDYDLSPYTGLTRQSWIEAGEYMLEGIFQEQRSGNYVLSYMMRLKNLVLRDMNGRLVQNIRKMIHTPVRIFCLKSS